MDFQSQCQSDEPVAAQPRVIIHVCETCRSGTEASDGPRDGARLADQTASLAQAGIAVVPVACLANCKRALSACIQRVDGWSYVFGELGLDASPDLIEGARLLASSADGLMPWKGRPDCLKRGMIARIPPIPTQFPKI
ncbi:DUF1636 family protein [Rhizobium helianthi]|uniref:DUF1636 family protein n=1 Tax=Rhizobium helianthi TaxID=1132695 RepID=A0ABW4M474_9HYPH